MPFQLGEYARLRPVAYHVTHRDNIGLLRATRRIRTAASLIGEAGAIHLKALRREQQVAVRVAEGSVVLNDQRPLIATNLQLPADWSMSDFVAYLNGFVYFWPGWDRGLIGAGQRLLAHYEADGPGVLRCSTSELFDANPDLVPEFCPFNSGAPRYHSGRRAFRGPNLFTDSIRFPRRASEVVELAFRGDVQLPPSTQLRAEGGWSSLFGPAG